MSETPTRQTPRRFQFSLRTLFVVVTAAATLVCWIGHEWEIVHERKYVANWIDQLNREAGLNETEGIVWAGKWPATSHLVRHLLGDQAAAWVNVEKALTGEEIERIVRAYPEAKQFLRRKESPSSQSDN